MYYQVPKYNGELDIDYLDLLEAIEIQDDFALVKLLPTAEKRDSWVEITQEEFEAVRPSDKSQPTPTLEEQIQQLQQDNLTLMLGLTSLYELLLGGE